MRPCIVFETKPIIRYLFTEHYITIILLLLLKKYKKGYKSVPAKATIVGLIKFATGKILQIVRKVCHT